VGDDRAHDLLRSPIGLQVLQLISERDHARLTDDDLRAIIPRLEVHISRYRSGYDSHVAWLKSRSNALAPLAEWLPRRMPGWWGDLDRTNQIWVARGGEPLEPARLAVDLAAMHREASKPKRALWTSTRTAPSITPWLDHGENQAPGEINLWAVQVSQEARVAEIHSPAAWASLVERYPGDSPGLIFTGVKHPPESAYRRDPDWHRVAQDWDAVHLSVGGWLTAQDVPYGGEGYRTELRGFDMESTVWFRWCFSSASPLAAA